jgi:hypothetical protein
MSKGRVCLMLVEPWCVFGVRVWWRVWLEFSAVHR